MAYENDLCDLARLLGDAAEDLKRAEALAADLACPIDPGEPTWQAMAELSVALAVLRERLDVAAPAEIIAACEAADRYLDEMGDRADGQLP